MKIIVSDLSVLSKLNVSAFVVAMGSNVDTHRAFDIALRELLRLGDLQMSSWTTGLDFTGKTKLVYHNACAMVQLDLPMSFAYLSEQLKCIEVLCGRESIGQAVPMDLDILAVFDDCIWQISKTKLPFKTHEKSGLLQVAHFLLDD